MQSSRWRLTAFEKIFMDLSGSRCSRPKKSFKAAWLFFTKMFIRNSLRPDWNLWSLSLTSPHDFVYEASGPSPIQRPSVLSLYPLVIVIVHQCLALSNGLNVPFRIKRGYSILYLNGILLDAFSFKRGDFYTFSLWYSDFQKSRFYIFFGCYSFGRIVFEERLFFTLLV